MPPPHDPETWINLAQTHLDALASAALDARIRCFHGQRAVELALKGVLIHFRIEFPFTHDLAALADLIPFDVPTEVMEASVLTPHAVMEMYPDTFTDLDELHVKEAIELASLVIDWCRGIVSSSE